MNNVETCLLVNKPSVKHPIYFTESCFYLLHTKKKKFNLFSS